MNFEEYENRKKILEKMLLEKIARLNYRYARLNCDVKIGDIIKYDNCIIQVDEIKYGLMHFGKPYCVFMGPKLTAKLMPYKSGKRDYIPGIYKYRKIEANKIKK